MRNPAHAADCNCADCWEPRPAPGQTVSEAIRQELGKELRLMDAEHLNIMIEMVSAEQQRRHPLPDTEYLAKADVEGIKEIVGILCDAFDKRMADKDKPEVRFIDAFMAMVNFDRLVLQENEKQMGLTLDQKRAFRSAFVATVSQSLMKRLMN